MRFWLSFIFSLTLLLSCQAIVDPFHSYSCVERTQMRGKLPDSLKLPLNYATTIRYSNWNLNNTALVTEKNFTDVLYVHRIDKFQTQTYILGQETTVIYNETSCTNNAKAAVSPDFYPVDPLIKEKITKNSYSIGDIINSLLQTSFDSAGINGMGVVGGVDSLAWVGCNFNASADNTTGIQVVVFYSGNKDAKTPYSKDFKNPIVLSIHFSTFKNGTNGTHIMLAHSSIDIAGLEIIPETQKEVVTALPRGQYCENMNLLNLPGIIPDRFGASIDFVNTKTKQIDNIEIMYDSVLKVTHFALDFNNDLDIPFVSGINIPKNLTKASIYRDFNYGIQYITSKDGRVCKSVQPLDASFGDCTTTPDGKVALVSAESILLNVSNAKFYKHGKLILEGVEVESYYAKGAQTDGGHFVVEVNYIPTDWTIEGVKGLQLHSIVHYHKDKDMKLTHETYIHFDSFQNYTALGPLWLKNNVFPCSTDSVEDNFFYVNLQNVSLQNIQLYGTENVECAIAEALSESVNVSVFRISYFMFKESGKSAIACFLLGKKADVTPTQTAYLKNELTVAQFKDALNKTVLSTGLVAKLITEDQKPAAININRLGVINTSDEPGPIVPTFIGYSGGSMFILSVFTFIFGAAISVGTYIFYTKRRTISGMTYQVFE